MFFIEFYVAASLPPAQRRAGRGIEKGFEGSWIQSSYLSEVNDVEFDLTTSIIADGEIEPLNVATGIAVYPHKEIILPWAYFDDCIEVTALKVAVEGRFFLVFQRGIHACKEAVMFGLEMGIEFPEVGCENGELRIEGLFVLVKVLSLHVCVHFEAAGVSMALLILPIPR